MKPANPGEFADIDRHFARFIGGFGGGELPRKAAALLSRDIRAGHICMDLCGGDTATHSLEEWRAALSANTAFGPPEAGRPLVIDARGRLYLRRYWEYQELLAAQILNRCERSTSPAANHEDLQLQAIETALASPFVIISGGPGTGKTTTVLRLLERVVSCRETADFRIALTAPTGKAAARLQEAINGASDRLRQCLHGQASTMNRLLGSIPGSVYFRQDESNPLTVDLVVVDEASMVSLTMMAKLFAALAPQTRVILLGDCDQLASVEAGAVLGDIAEAARMPGSLLANSLVVLEKNYRFGDESAIYQLCRAVRDGDSTAALSILGKKASASAGVDAQSTPAASELMGTLRLPVLEGFRAYLQSDDPAEALTRFQDFRVLCALRVGPFGAVALNHAIQQMLLAAGLIDGTRGFYRGLPVLITRNDYQLQLFNGDVGILLPERPGSSQLMAWFPGENGALRHIAPARLPEHEPAFAMTIHKSQGSEFENVLLLLPDEDQPLLTRELVYTGLTRARKRVSVWVREAVLRAAIERKTRRSSGLADRLIAGKAL